MSKPDILQIGPYPEWDVVELEKKFTLHRYFDAEDKRAFVKERADKIRGIATRGELGADRELIASLPKLEIISIYGVGYDAVDLEAARERGILVTNTPDVLTKDAADFGVAMMLTGARGIVGAENWVRTKRWELQGNFPLQSRIHGKRVGILGLGRIGYQIALRCAAFEMGVAYSSTAERNFSGNEQTSNWRFRPNPVDLAEHSDFLFVTLKGGPDTRHIVNKEVLNALGPSGMLINVSRASNIDETALLEALRSKTLGFAALDVFENEPDLNPEFFELDNILLQPHQATATIETRKAMGALMRDNLEAHFNNAELLTPIVLGSDK